MLKQFMRLLPGFFCSALICIVLIAGQTVAHAAPVNKRIIVIDAGHGDWDPGKVSRGVEEKGINLQVAEKLQWLLELSGAVVLTTRSADTSLADQKRADLSARARMANAANADIFVSIHQNSFNCDSVSGGQVFYHASSEESKNLADLIQGRLNSFIGDHKGKPRTRPAKASESYYVLKQTNMPAVIVECGFMSNYKDLQLLQDEDFQERIVWAVYMGIAEYFAQKSDDKESVKE